MSPFASDFMDSTEQNFKRTSGIRARTQPGLPQFMGNLPPQALDLEASVLGAIMIKQESVFEVMEFLRPESFYKEAHGHIFQAMLNLAEEKNPVDLLTVGMELRKMGLLEAAGGHAYIVGLTNRLNSAGNLVAHARYVQEMAIKRELIKVSTDITKEAYEDTQDVFELLDTSEQKLFNILDANVKRNYRPIDDILQQAIRDLEVRRGQKDGITGVPSGFTKLDNLTAGWQKGALIIIAARPAMGKTAFVLSTSRNAAVDFDNAVAIFSLEMPSVDLALRMMSSEAEVESDKLRKGNLSDEEWAGLTRKLDRLSKAPIYIDDTSSLTVLELRAKCRRLKSQGRLDLVIIDYLQLMSGGNTSQQKNGNREQEIAYISRSLKQLAKELDVPVIALSQLSRAVESRGGDKTPQLSDLRESGSLEQDADMVIFLHRPFYYGIKEDENGNSTEKLGNIIIAKHRAGQTDTIQLQYEGKYTKFSDLDEFGGGFNDFGGFGGGGNSGGGGSFGSGGGFGGGFGAGGGGGFSGGSIPSEFNTGSITVASGLKAKSQNGNGGGNPIAPKDDVPF